VREIFSSLQEHAWVEPPLLNNFMMCVRKAMGLHLEKLLFKTLDAVLELFGMSANRVCLSICVLCVCVCARAHARGS